MNVILFVVEEAEDGAYRASAVGQAIHTEADSLQELHQEIRDAMHCHYDAGQGPPLQLWSIFSRHNRTARSSSSTLDVTTPQTIS